MIGIPMFCGFISKLLFAQAGMENIYKMFPTLIALAISTILNAVYFMKTVIRIYTPVSRKEIQKNGYRNISIKEQPVKSVALILFIILNLILGLCSEPIVAALQSGLGMFA